jgi:hypothetical protein
MFSNLGLESGYVDRVFVLAPVPPVKPGNDILNETMTLPPTPLSINC